MNQQSRFDQFFKYLSRVRLIVWLFGSVYTASIFVALLLASYAWHTSLVISVFALFGFGLVANIAMWATERFTAKPQLAIEYDPAIHFNKRWQRLSFDVVNRPGNQRVERIRVKIESMVPLTDTDDVRQLSVDFTEHCLSPMRQPGSGEFDLNEGDRRNMLLCWSSLQDKRIHFSGFDNRGVYNEDGFTTLKTAYDIRLIVVSANGAPASALIRISHDEGGSLLCEMPEAAAK